MSDQDFTPDPFSVSNARVIRADRAGPTLVPAAVADASQQARTILERAHARAEQRMREALEEGRTQARAEVASELLALARARDRLLTELEPQVVKLALLLARRVIGEQIALEPVRVADMVAPLLARVRRAKQVTLRVHPEDQAALEPCLAGLRESAELACAVRLEADPALERGDCVVVSDAGVLDARIETQLRALARALGAD